MPYISSYSHCYAQIPDKRVHFGSQFESTVRHGGEGVAAGARMLVFSSYMSFMMLAHTQMLYPFGEGLASSAKLFWKHPHRHSCGLNLTVSETFTITDRL